MTKMDFMITQKQLKMENFENEFYFFSFDSLEIYGGFKGDVHVPALRIEEGELSKDEECILSIERSMFMNMFNEWITEKIQCCDRFGHYCGVGHVLCSAKRLNDTIMYDYEENEDGEIVVTEIEKTIYQVTSFDIDIEHG